MVAAVRLAYKVADAQITRSTTLAQRLRAAGDRAVGEQSDRKALDATERLVLLAFMSVLAWMEGVAPGADAENPLKRLLTAEWRMVGSILGLGTASAARSAGHQAPEAPPVPPSPPPEAARPDATVFLLGESKRPVLIVSLVLPHGPLNPVPLTFYHSARIGDTPMPGTFSSDGSGRAELRITTSPNAPSGLWKAAICIEDMQIGLIQIEL